jgi:indolepyruvate ferredoxin oxidoreductase alpha subunit
MQIGCPAVSIENGTVKIDNTLCTGCGVCAQMCKFDVFETVKEGK